MNLKSYLERKKRIAMLVNVSIYLSTIVSIYLSAIAEDLNIYQKRKLKVIIVVEDDKRDALKKALLNSPIWSDEDVENFRNAVKEGYENWEPEQL